jgi:hypothetical protein
MDKLEVIVKGNTGTGKSHVMAVIERALMLEYGDDVKITSEDLRAERNLVGEDIREWQRPDGKKVEMVIREENTVPEIVLKSLAMTFPANYPTQMVELVNKQLAQPIMASQYNGLHEVTLEYLPHPDVDPELFAHYIDHINQDVRKYNGDTDWAVLLFREGEYKEVTQATMIYSPLMDVRLLPSRINAERVSVTFLGRRDTCEDNKFFAAWVKNFSDERRTDKKNVIRMTNEYMVRTVRK